MCKESSNVEIKKFDRLRSGLNSFHGELFLVGSPHKRVVGIHVTDCAYTCEDRSFLPPASEGWGKVIFSVWPHMRGGGGTLSQVCGWGGGTPSQVWGVSHLRSGWGDTPSQVRMVGGILGYPPDQVWMVGGGTPSQVWVGWYPIPGLDVGRGYPGVPPSRSGWCGGYQVWMVGGYLGYWMGYPPPPHPLDRAA